MIFLNKFHIFEYGQNERGSMKILFLINNNCHKGFIEIGKTKCIKNVLIKLELEKKNLKCYKVLCFSRHTKKVTE